MTRVEALSALAEWQLELGEAGPAAHTVSGLTAAARDLRQEPGRWQHTDPLRQAVGVAARVSGREQAVALELEVLPDEFIHDKAAKAVVAYAVKLAKAGDLEHARELLGTEPFAWGWWRGLEAIADTLASRNDLAEASEVYARAAQAVQQDPGLSTGQETVSRQLLKIALLFARLGDAHAALGLIGVEPGAADPPQVPGRYQVPIARILALTGLSQAAEQLLDRVPEVAEFEWERDRPVEDIAGVQALLPDPARFFATVQQISNPASTAEVLGRVAAGWARDGRIPQALQLAGQIHADQAREMLPLAEELARAGRRRELLELAGRYLDGEFSLALCPILAQVDPGSLDGMADALLRLSLTPGG
jgi:tetratricopeptide (TPR) repeat protein